MSLNKVAVVTGANKGLGFEITRGLCEKYTTVYLTSRDSTRGTEACKKLQVLGLNPKYHQLDITDDKSVQEFIETIQKNQEHIDTLINNAGILFLKDSKENKIYQAEQTLKVNFFSLVNFCEAVLPLMSDGGKIMNISSSSGHLSRIPSEKLRGKLSDMHLCVGKLRILMVNYLEAVRNETEMKEGWGSSPYVVSKVAVNAYTFILHRRLVSKGISVSCIHPGYIQSDMTRGVGSVSSADGARVVINSLDLRGGSYIWHNGQTVMWDGEDPRIYIDGKIF